MKNKIIFSATLFILFLSAYFFLGTDKANTVKVPGDAYSFGDREEQKARQEWEWKMLRDPETGEIPVGMRAKELAFAQTLPKDAENPFRSGQDFVLQGPYNIGGRTRAIAVDISNENVVMAGSVSGGLYRSADAGSTWTKVTSPTQYLGVTALAQDKRTGHTNTWYYSTGEGYGTSASGSGAFYLGDGMFKSTDGGLNWNPIAATAGGQAQTFTTNWQVLWNVATHPNDTADVVFAATYDAIYRSLDGGGNWSAALAGPGTSSASYFTDVACTSTGVAYATFSSDGPKKGIWRSPDGIAPFVNITPNNFFNGTDTISWPQVFDRTVMGIDPNNENVVYFLSETPGFGKLSLDFQADTEWVSFWKYEYLNGNGDSAGGFWTDLSQNLPFDGSQFGNIVLQGSYDMLVKVMPGNSNVIFVGGTNLYRSTDGFTSSNNTAQLGGYGIGTTLPFFTAYPGHHADQHNVFFLPSNPNVMYSSTDGGVFKTTDCLAQNVAWTSLNHGYYTTQLYTVAIDHGTSGSHVVTGGFQDYGSWWTNSADPMASWTFPSSGDGSYCAVADGGGTYYYSQQQGKMMKATLDNNGSVTAFRRFDPIGPTKNDYQFINPFVLDPADNTILYLSEGENLWRNNDLGSITLDGSWDTISTGWTKYSWHLPDTTMNIIALAASKNSPHRLYFGTDKKKVYKMDNAHTGDPTPVEITASSMPGAGYVSCIAVDPRDADKVMVVFSNYKVYSIYYSEDAGTTWKKVAGNLEQNSTGSGNGPSIRWATILPVPDGTIYLVGASTGLYATDTLVADATVWVQQGTNSIGNAVVNMIDGRESDGFVAIATHGNGVYTTNYTSAQEITGIKENQWSNVNVQWSIYPNPARENATVEFELAKNSKTTLVLYDEMGRLSQTIISKNITSGKHQVQLNTSGLANGIYYCSLTTVNSDGEKKETRTLVIGK